MPEQKTQQTPAQPTPAQPEKPKNEGFEQARSDSLSPDQKHQNYLDDLERLHNEP